MIEFTLNGQPTSVDAEPDTPLLWVLREQLGLTGTKFGCGIGQCGACTVQFNGIPMRSCLLPVGGVIGQQVRTIEALDHPVQAAWIAEQVPQCGYCQSGQLMAAAALLDKNPEPADNEIDVWMTNICRCATYPRIRAAIRRAGAAMPRPEPPPEPQPDDAAPEAPAEGGEL